MDRLNQLHTTESNNDLFLKYLKLAQDSLGDLVSQPDQPRFHLQNHREQSFGELIEKYSTISLHQGDAGEELQQVVHDLFDNVVRWESPQLQINVGTVTNSAAAAVYALALQENIINVNSVVAGNTLVAEHAVTNIMASLAKLPEKPYGIFTYGGSGTNLYALKIGLRKACPDVSKRGMWEKVRIFVTEDAHFSHATAADWLGVGVDNVITIKALPNRSTDVRDLEWQLQSSIELGYKIGAIYINGGTTFDHTIDDIAAIVRLRDQLAEEHSLSYKPHIHADTVIGWAWLMFSGYNWKANPLQIPSETLQLLRAQYDLVKQVKLADSWGIDFHKATGACPVASSMIMINRFEDAMLLSRMASTGVSTHQLAEEYQTISPMQYTLENCRSGGVPLAALIALRTIGQECYQRKLANLVDQTRLMRELLDQQPHIQIANSDSLGFTTLVRLIPPELADVDTGHELTDTSPGSKERTEFIGRYTKAFFTWDSANRMKKGIGVEYSFTDKYFTNTHGTNIYTLKIYPVSPAHSAAYVRETADTITKQAQFFRENVWNKK